MAFGVCNGPLLWAVPLFRNSLVFHSLGKISKSGLERKGGRERGRGLARAGSSAVMGACEHCCCCLKLPCVLGTDRETPIAHIMNSLRFHPHQPRAGHLCHSLVLDGSIRRFRLSAFAGRMELVSARPKRPRGICRGGTYDPLALRLFLRTLDPVLHPGWV